MKEITLHHSLVFSLFSWAQRIYWEEFLPLLFSEKGLCNIAVISSLNIWRNSAMKLSRIRLFLVQSLTICYRSLEKHGGMRGLSP